LVERTNSGFGTVSTSGAVLPKIAINPKVTGVFNVCASAIVANGTTGIASRLQLTDGTNVISTGHATSTATYVNQVNMCGLLNIATIAPVTLAIQAASASGTVTIESLSSGASVKAVEWYIYPVSQRFPAPIFTDIQNLNSGFTTEVISLGATTTPPTKGTMAVDRIVWHREGHFMAGTLDFQQTVAGVAGSGAYLITIPGGNSLDLGMVTINSSIAGTTLLSPGLVPSTCSSNIGGTQGLVGYMTAHSATQLKVTGLWGAANLNPWGSTQSALSNTTVNVTCSFRLPISGW
jgi:hypothetical protein